jgi:hypothetical protein
MQCPILPSGRGCLTHIYRSVNPTQTIMLANAPPTTAMKVHTPSYSLRVAHAVPAHHGQAFSEHVHYLSITVEMPTRLINTTNSELYTDNTLHRLEKYDFRWAKFGYGAAREKMLRAVLSLLHAACFFHGSHCCHCLRGWPWNYLPCRGVHRTADAATDAACTCALSVSDTCLCQIP